MLSSATFGCPYLCWVPGMQRLQCCLPLKITHMDTGFRKRPAGQYLLILSDFIIAIEQEFDLFLAIIRNVIETPANLFFYADFLRLLDPVNNLMRLFRVGIVMMRQF